MRDEFESLQAKRLYDKGMEIVEVVGKICALIPEDNEQLVETRSWMRADAHQMVVKISVALCH